jgi:hypothetical protein
MMTSLQDVLVVRYSDDQQTALAGAALTGRWNNLDPAGEVVSSTAGHVKVRRCPLNPRHVVVMDGARPTIIPFDHHTAPFVAGDCAHISDIALPANTIADFEPSGLVAGHGCA